MLKTKELIKEIKGWLDDYDKTIPDNCQSDYDEATFGGSAY